MSVDVDRETPNPWLGISWSISRTEPGRNAWEVKTCFKIVTRTFHWSKHHAMVEVNWLRCPEMSSDSPKIGFKATFFQHVS